MKFIIKFFTSVLLLWTFSSAWTQPARYEKDYLATIQSLVGGQTEVTVSGGRVDLVADDVAYEIEWASNWKEAIGQSLWYGLNTNKKPGIVLILKGAKDYKYFVQLNTALDYAGLTDSVEVLAYPIDFEGLLWATESLSRTPQFWKAANEPANDPACSQNIRVLITTATTRAYNRESRRLKSLTTEYENAIEEILSGEMEDTIHILDIQNQILQPYQEELARDISNLKGVKVKFGRPFLGAWEGRPEPSMNMTICLDNHADTRALSGLLYDMAERSAQDAFILEEYSEITDRIPLSVVSEDGYLHYPQIRVYFENELSLQDQVTVAKILLRHGFQEFSIGRNLFFISLVDFDDSVAAKIKILNDIRDLISQVLDDVATQVSLPLACPPVVVNRKSVYISARNAGHPKQQHRTYDRRDIFRQVGN